MARRPLARWCALAATAWAAAGCYDLDALRHLYSGSGDLGTTVRPATDDAAAAASADLADAAGCDGCQPPDGAAPAVADLATPVTCPAGQHYCGTCVDNNSFDHCGSSCSPCPQPVHSAGTTCNGTACILTCQAGYKPANDACVPLQWKLQTSSVTGTLVSIWGSSRTDIYACGENALLHSDGSGVWKPQTIPTTTTLYRLLALAANDIYAVGGNDSTLAGLVLHSTGNGTWSSSTIDAIFPTSIWGVSGKLYLAGIKGAVAGSSNIVVGSGNGTWTAENTGTAVSKTLLDLRGVSTTSLFAVGGAGTLLHSTGNGTWSAQTSGVPATNLNGLFVASPVDIYVAGDGDTILFSTGDGTWKSQSTGTTHDWTSIWGPSYNDLYVFGGAGTIMHSTGDGHWTDQPTPTDATLWSMWGSSATDLYVVGTGGTILHLE